MPKFKTHRKHAAVIEKTNGCCGYCGVRVEDDQKTIEHIVPRSKGGTDLISNLMLSCRTCNTAKGAKSKEEYRTWLKWRDVAREQKFTVYQMIWILENSDIASRIHLPDVEFYCDQFEEIPS